MKSEAIFNEKTKPDLTPMIDVVFLLLIFFLMSARIAPPDPFEVAPPRADGFEGGPLDPAAALFLGAEGDVGFGAARGEEALAAAARAALGERPQGEAPATLPVRADGELQAAALAMRLRQLAELGVRRVEIAVAPQ